MVCRTALVGGSVRKIQSLENGESANKGGPVSVTEQAGGGKSPF